MKNATAAQMRIGLRIHAIAFVASMAVMVVINVLTGAPYWVVWVLLGWGVGILSHWLAVRRHLAL
jgi:2TM domain